jgi:biotin operon repressor
MNLADIGHIVHTRRTALGLSQARLAAMSGLSRTTVHVEKLQAAGLSLPSVY